MRACFVCLWVVAAGACDGSDPPGLSGAMATTGAWEAATATVHVHYPDGHGAITVQLSSGADVQEPGTADAQLAATAPPPIECAADQADRCTATIARFPLGEKVVAVRPQLAGANARGARYLVERDGTIDIYPHFTATHGTKRTLIPAFHSATLEPFEPGNQREIVAYLPASYDENTAARYPVIYFHDGQAVFDAGRHLDVTLEAGWEDTGAFDEFIAIAVPSLVTINGALTGTRTAEYNPTPSPIAPGPPLGEPYATAVATELKPAVDALLRTRPEPEHTFVAGWSIGASISTWIAYRYPTVFGGYAGLSEANGLDFQWIVDQLPSSPPAPRLSRIYLDMGTDLDSPQTLAPFVAAYRALGYVDGADLFTFVDLGASHEPYAWGRRFPLAFSVLVPARRAP